MLELGVISPVELFRIRPATEENVPPAEPEKLTACAVDKVAQ